MQIVCYDISIKKLVEISIVICYVTSNYYSHNVNETSIQITYSYSHAIITVSNLSSSFKQKNDLSGKLVIGSNFTIIGNV